MLVDTAKQFSTVLFKFIFESIKLTSYAFLVGHNPFDVAISCVFVSGVLPDYDDVEGI